MIRIPMILPVLILMVASQIPARAQVNFEYQERTIGFFSDPLASQALQLDEEQVVEAQQAIKALRSRDGEDRRRIKALGLPDDEAAEALRLSRRKLAAQHAADLDAILKPEQKAQFRTIVIQRIQAVALADPTLQAELELTDEQKTRIEDVLTRRMAKLRQAMGLLTGKFKDQMAVDAVVNAVDRETQDELLAILTDAQRMKWDAMPGQPSGRQLGR